MKFNRTHSFLLSTLFIFSFFILILSARLSAAPSFWNEPGTRISEGSPSVVTSLTDGATAIFYSDSYSINIATSTDGLTFTEKTFENVVSTQSAGTGNLDDTGITACSIINISGEYRMTYAATSSTGVYSILHATSTDMVSWSTVTAFGPFMIGDGTTFIGSPFILATTSQYYLFYTRDKNTGNDADDYVIAYATSPVDNFAHPWSEVSSSLISDRSKDPHVIALSNGSYRMYYAGDSSDSQAFGAIRSATSSDLVTFATENDAVITRAAAGDTLSHPRAVKSSDGYTYRLYYGYTLSSKTTAYTLTARTTAPHLISVLPENGPNNAPVNFTLSGEIFSPSVTVTLSFPAQSDIPATNVTRLHDNTITGTFNITSQVTRDWTLTLTNSNGETDTLFFEIYRPGITEGIVEITENVFNPSRGQKASINYTIFDEGQVTIKLYTIIGERVKTLVDEFKTANSYTDNWDGRNMHNDTVASGIYIMHISAPGLKKIKKIAVIK